MQQYAGINLLQNHSTCFGCPSHPSSGVHKIVTAVSGTGHSIWVTTYLQRDLKVTLEEGWYPDTMTYARGCSYSFIGHVGGRLLPRYYDLYQRLQLQFCVLLMMGAMDTRNM
jgi:hypothetical protein